MKKILFIYDKNFIQNRNANLHTRWPEYLSDEYGVQWWGPGFSDDLSHRGLEEAIEKFQPDFVYMTIRSRYRGLDIRIKDIKVPTVFVECDAWNYKVEDAFYSAFDKLYTRTIWNVRKGWESVPLLRWSVPEQKIEFVKDRPHNVGLIGTGRKGYYPTRFKIRQELKSVSCGEILKPDIYWNSLRSYKALVCPTESIRGNFLPGKFFEYLTSGAAVLTNADLDYFGVPEFNDLVIKYSDVDDLAGKLDMDFSKYHEIAFDILREKFTDRVRYREVFS